MKTIRHLLPLVMATLLAWPTWAQRHSRHHATTDDPAVYLISIHEVDTFLTDCTARQQAALMNRLATASAIADHQQTWRTGFHQPHQPQFLFASKNNRFSLTLGGTVDLRVSYEFEGTVDNIDFRPSAIPMQPTYDTSQRLMMDATTTRLFLKAITNTRLGPVVVFLDGDFRGGSEGSYTPHVRSAFVGYLGFTAGRDVTTFCDLQAAAPTIDFRGPNAYNYRYTTLLRYEHAFLHDMLSMGVAAEMPRVSATYGENYAPLAQRMPDFPIYLQVAWGRDRQSHIRLSGVFRNMYAYDLLTQDKTSLFGWGAQVSGHIDIVRFAEIYFNGVYGQGVSPYIQDLTGLGLDFTPNPASPTSIQAIPAYGWQAAARFHLIPNLLSVAGGYSMVQVNHRNGVISNDIYRQGQYIFGNIFCNVTPRMTLAVEYLYGTRKDMSGDRNHANRANFQVSYHF